MSTTLAILVGAVAAIAGFAVGNIAADISKEAKRKETDPTESDKERNESDKTKTTNYDFQKRIRYEQD